MRLAPLIGIEVAAFLLIIGETYLFFMTIVPLGPVPHNLTVYTAITLLKVGLTFGLGILWLVVMVSLTRLYVRSRLRTQTPTSSS
ncbi:MAG: hypothetical protein ABSB53_01295 [Nitrososphaerales archaeon]|jgi:hypothetical protein